MDLKPVRVIRDFPPEDMRLRTWLFGHFRAVAQLFAFEEYDASFLSPKNSTRARPVRRSPGNFIIFGIKGTAR